MIRIFTRFILLVVISFSVFTAGAKARSFKWKIITDPYRNFIYPQQTGLQYNLAYNYLVEAKSLRNYLDKNFDLRNSPSISKILKDISTGVYFDRYFDFKIKYVKPGDTLVAKIVYANGEVVSKKIVGGNGHIRLNIHLTQYKNQFDFTTGKTKDDRKRGLVTSVDLMVLSRHRSKNHVVVMSKLYTQADMPGIISRLNGRNLFK